MSAPMIESVRSTEDLKTNLSEVLRQVRRSRGPVLITKAGRPDLVIMDVDTYRYRLHVANLTHLLAEGMDDIRRGRTKPLDEFIKELERGQATPGRNRRKRPT
jgi:prevent-host-death family protein